MTSSLSPSLPHICAEKIRNICPSFQPSIGIVLGSGLGRFIEHLENPVVVPYADLPGFPRPQVKGHDGNLVLGYLHGIAVICLQGRSHSYEGTSLEYVKTYVRTLHLLGCKHFFATNASGSLHKEIGPGDLVLIHDHINLQPSNPLTGPNDDEFGPRFYPLDNAYDKDMREKLLRIAEEEDITLHEGIYIAVLGPNYETAAEIRAFKILGGDVVGMSTVPEVLVANHCGMKVAVVSVVSNYATGLNTESHSHDAVLSMAEQGGIALNRLLKRYILSLKND